MDHNKRRKNGEEAFEEMIQGAFWDSCKEEITALEKQAELERDEIMAYADADLEAIFARIKSGAGEKEREKRRRNEQEGERLRNRKQFQRKRLRILLIAALIGIMALGGGITGAGKNYASLKKVMMDGRQLIMLLVITMNICM